MGSPSDEPVGQRWVRSSLHHEGEGILIHPPYQGDCGRHGTEEQRVTSGELAESAGGTGVSRPISESEVASDALSVVGRLNSTYQPVVQVADFEQCQWNIRLGCPAKDFARDIALRLLQS
jgi:hypothetical protein